MIYFYGNRFKVVLSLTDMREALRRLFLFGIPLLTIELLTGGILSALPYGSGDYGTCTYDTCGISLTTSGNVTLSATPTSSGVHTTAQDELEVSTDASTGYTVTMLDSDTDVTLSNGADAFAASSGTPASPISLAMNTWGYRVDGLSGFGAGPTSSQTNDASALYTFAGVPPSNGTAHTIVSTSAAANPPEITDVWYGVRIDTANQAGTYTNTISYTAVTND